MIEQNKHLSVFTNSTKWIDFFTRKIIHGAKGRFTQYTYIDQKWGTQNILIPCVSLIVRDCLWCTRCNYTNPSRTQAEISHGRCVRSERCDRNSIMLSCNAKCIHESKRPLWYPFPEDPRNAQIVLMNTKSTLSTCYIDFSINFCSPSLTIIFTGKGGREKRPEKKRLFLICRTNRRWAAAKSPIANMTAEWMPIKRRVPTALICVAFCKLIPFLQMRRCRRHVMCEEPAWERRDLKSKLQPFAATPAQQSALQDERNIFCTSWAARTHPQTGAVG